MQHTTRDYAWGSTTLIPQLLGVTPDGEPHAELWFGAHADSPSIVELPDGERALDDWIIADARAVLGSAVLDHFGPRLPYLIKVLAAATPLSLQVHPSQSRARLGYEQEEQAGVPHTARERRYKDPFHKPEMVLALTPFEALCGLRPLAETHQVIDGLPVDDPGWAMLLGLLDPHDEPRSLRAAFEYLLGGTGHAGLVEAVATACRSRLDHQGPWAEVDSTVVDLAKAYPGDPGVIVALLLNRLTLSPGEALYLPDGNVHAYLSGLGIEVMASSDNVLRAGLTTKYVDIAELMTVVDFHPRPHPYVEPVVDGAVRRYQPGAAEFELAVIEVDGGAPVPLHEPGPRVLVCLEGELTASGERGGTRRLSCGHAVFVPGSDGAIEVSGTGMGVLAGVPLPARA